MSYEEEIGLKSGRRRRLKAELVSDEDISICNECQWCPNSHDKCSNKEYLKNIKDIDISASVNRDGGNEQDSNGNNCSLQFCCKMGCEHCIATKTSRESRHERQMVNKSNNFTKCLSRKQNNVHRSHVFNSYLHKHVKSIETIVSKIESDVRKTSPTALHKKCIGVSRKDQNWECEMSFCSKLGLFDRRKQIPKIHKKHSRINSEKCRIELDFPEGLGSSFYLGDSDNIANQIYRKYLTSNPMTVRYSKIISKIKEKITNFEQPFCSMYYQKKIHSYFDRKSRHSNCKENRKFILFGLHQIRHELICLFPVYGNTKNLEEFVEREIDQNQGSNNQQTSCHSLNMELIRLGSFHNFPSSGSVSTVKLARQGFYYSSESAAVICFACGLTRNDWEIDDNVEAIHRAASPNCPLLNSSSSDNVPIGGNGANGFVGASVSQNESQQGIHGSLTNGSNNGSKALPNNEGISRNVGDCMQNHSSNRPPRDPLTKARDQQEKINAFIRDLDPLGINFDRPKYPSYAVLAVRISSFTDWPSSITQTPRDLAMAGFFYAGYGDYTRCFFCGGGLRNWEPGDDPWTEHARWFSKCAFLRQNKGDEFVALVQIEQQEKEVSEGMNGPSGDQPNDMRSTSRPSHNSPESNTTHSGFQSLLEMGYSSQAIQIAFDLLKESKESIDIKGEELLELVLAQEETNGEGILPPSATGCLEEKTTSVEQSKQFKTKASKSVACEELNKGNDSDTCNQRDLKSVSQSLASTSIEETMSLVEENRKLKDIRLCKICLENDASIAMLPCGHLCCCPDCAPAMRKCPICRQFVKGTVRTWLV